MRKAIVVVFFILLAMFSGNVVGINTSAYSTMTLKDAISRGYVHVEIYGTGDYYGRSIYMYIELIKDVTIQIKIDRGVILVPTSDYSEYQRMVVASPETVTLSGEGDAVEGYVYAFCIDPFKEVPEYFVEFTVDGKASYNLISLLEKIDEEGMLDEWEAQLAVWIAANPSEADKIMEKFVMEDYEDLVAEYGKERAAKYTLEVLKPTVDLLDSVGLDYLIDKHIERLERDAQKPFTDMATEWLVKNWYVIFILLIIISAIISVVKR